MPKRNKPGTNSPYKESFRKIQAILIKRMEKSILIELAAEIGTKVWVPRSTLSMLCDQRVEQLRERDEFVLEVADWKANDLGI